MSGPTAMPAPGKTPVDPALQMILRQAAVGDRRGQFGGDGDRAFVVADDDVAGIDGHAAAGDGAVDGPAEDTSATSATDPDDDGYERELEEGSLTATALYLALLPTPHSRATCSRASSTRARARRPSGRRSHFARDHH